MKSSWQPIIGLEVHIELKTKSKMFCSCKNEHFNIEPNTNVCPVCLGLPGALPIPNKQAIEQTIILALAFGCKINQSFWFDRKNYFYPDLPKGFQISQHFYPVGIGGQVPLKEGAINLSDLHLEEDTGKSIHQQKETQLDFNRSGVPLVEIVTKPEIKSSKQAKEYLKRIQQTVRWLELSDCDMEKGSMRLEANISVRNPSKIKPGQLPKYKVEVKNLNSFRFVEKAIDYEIERQTKILKQGKTPKQETRGFDSTKGVTFSQRSKETSKDYRYFPEPDIPPFNIDDQKIKELKKTIESLPWQREQLFVKKGLSIKWAEIICSEKRRAEKLIRAMAMAEKEGIEIKKIANQMVNKPNPQATAQQIIDQVKKEKDRFSLSDDIIEKAAQKVIDDNPDAAQDYRNGKTQVIGFFIGQIQRQTQGKADPKKAAKAIAKLLGQKES